MIENVAPVGSEFQVRISNFNETQILQTKYINLLDAITSAREQVVRDGQATSTTLWLRNILPFETERRNRNPFDFNPPLPVINFYLNRLISCKVHRWILFIYLFFFSKKILSLHQLFSLAHISFKFVQISSRYLWK